MRNNFTGSEASGSVPIEITLLTTEITNVVIVVEILLSEYSPVSATGAYKLWSVWYLKFTISMYVYVCMHVCKLNPHNF